MSTSDLLTCRLHNQLITNSNFHSPEEAVAWFGAVQAQDYLGAKWALGLRTNLIGDFQVDEALHQGRILRTHVMRPTWHFVAPNDIRWMLQLTKKRVHKFNSYYYRQLGLDTTILGKYMSIIYHALHGNTYLTRKELADKLIKTYNNFTQESNLAVGYILMYAELEGVICSGPRQGKQFTYALLEERVPKGILLDAEASLAQLTLRYFQSHGPATMQDFVWWSGLTASDAKKGIALLKSTLDHEKIEENIYWFVSSNSTNKVNPNIYLLPNYDEYIVGYKDRQFIFDHKHTIQLDARGNPLFQHSIILDGKIIGTWKREFKANSVALSTHIFESLPKTKEKMLERAIERFCVYVN